MKSDNKLTLIKASNKTKTIINWIAAVISLLMVIGSVGVMVSPPKEGETKGETWAGIVVLVLFALIAGFCIYRIVKLKKQKRMLANYREYIARLSNDKEKSLGKVALGMNLPVEKVEADVNALIKLGLIKNAYIDKSAHTLILPEYDLYDKIPDVVLVTVKCDCCGGNSRIPENTIGSCQFCGSPVSAKQ